MKIYFRKIKFLKNMKQLYSIVADRMSQIDFTDNDPTFYGIGIFV